METVRTRFAPSPTGYLHLGGLRTALYAYLMAKKNNGVFILRIEDTDQNRYVEGAVDVIYRTMAECGLDHDEGPDVGGPVAPYIQSQRRDTYGRYAQLLVEKGLIEKELYGDVFLTEKGRAAAHALETRRDDLALLFARQFGLSPEESLKAAFALMSELSDESLEKIHS